MLGGGGGSIQHMITTLRNNKNLLRRRSKFKRKKHLSEILESYANSEIRKTELIHKEASPEVLEQIRQDCKKVKRREGIIYATVSFLVFAALVYFSYIIVTEDNKIYRSNLEKKQQRLEQKRMNGFNLIMLEGREYIKV